jgi:NADH:ubiquinone oxidoreductase subunit C
MTLQTSDTRLEKVTVRINPNTHRDALKILLEKDETAGIAAITGVDLGETVEIMHNIRTHGIILTIRAQIPKKDLRIRTVIDMLSGTNFHEREVADLFGVTLMVIQTRED